MARAKAAEPFLTTGVPLSYDNRRLRTDFAYPGKAESLAVPRAAAFVQIG